LANIRQLKRVKSIHTSYFLVFTYYVNCRMSSRFHSLFRPSASFATGCHYILSLIIPSFCNHLHHMIHHVFIFQSSEGILFIVISLLSFICSLTPPVIMHIHHALFPCYSFVIADYLPFALFCINSFIVISCHFLFKWY